MKISDKRHSDLYASISGPIQDLRILHQMGHVINWDRALCDLENKIYREVADTLKVEIK